MTETQQVIVAGLAGMTFIVGFVIGVLIGLTAKRWR